MTRTLAVTLARPFPAGVSAIINSACAATTTPGDPAANNCSSATAPVTASPALSIAKSLLSGTATPGDLLVFKLDLRNDGDQDAANFVMEETVPANTTFDAASSSPGWACSGASCSLTIPTLAGAGGTTSRTFGVRVVNPLPAGVTTISNTACIRSLNPRCDTIDVPTDGRPLLNLVKRLLSGTPTPGSVLTYEIQVQNTGNQGAKNVTLSETVPSHTTFESAASSSGWTCSSPAAGSACTLSAGPLAGGGASLTRTFAVRIVNPLPAGVSVIANTACVGSLCDTTSIPPDASPVLAIEKALTSGVPDPGNTVIFTITVRNTGNQDAGPVTVTDTVPDFTELVAVASDPGWACAPGPQARSSCSVTTPSLAAGSSRAFLFAVRIASTLPAEATLLRNTACASDDPARLVCATAESPLGGEPSLTIVKTYDGSPLTPGAVLVFHLAVTNLGARDAEGVVLRDQAQAHGSRRLLLLPRRLLGRHVGRELPARHLRHDDGGGSEPAEA